jgi:WD40 repeat protein/tRNA A-37 threonylcarbamoyl transferase component Bud32
VIESTILNVGELQGLDEAIGAYYEAVDRGEAPDPIAWQNRYPELAGELAEFFENLERIGQVVMPLKEAVRGVNPARPELGRLERNQTAENGTGRNQEGATISEGDDYSGLECDRPGGTRLRKLGDFELIRPLGRGAMGVVYEAQQLSLNRRVAVKMIRAGAFATEAEVQRFRNEAEAVAQLDHPRIVPIHEVGTIEDCHYFSMKLISGGSLAHQLDAFRCDTRAAARIVMEVAGAIQHAHQRGILHRDLKPANVLLDEHDQPQVSDFGLAKRFADDSSLTESGAILGTPSYMAPEQTAGRKGLVTTLTDVYGLGAVLYALLTGHAPFLAETVIETIEQVRQRPPVPPSRLNPRVSRDLETICLKCLEKEPQRRYASAQALADDLKRWLDGEPIAARRVNAWERAWMWCRRNPIVAGLLAASVLLALGATWQWQRAEGLLLEAQYKASSVAIDQALELCAQGKVASGMLHLARALETAPPNAADLKRVARANLVAWSRYSTRLTNLLPHQGEVYFVAFSPDGGTALTLSNEVTARLWDARTGEPRGEPLRHQGGVIAAAFSPDGLLVATGSMDRTARLWKVPSGRPLGEAMRQGAPVRSVAFSPDGRLLLTGTNDGDAREWSVADQQQLTEPIRALGQVYEIAFGPDSHVALIGAASPSTGIAQRWDVQAHRTIGRPVALHQPYGGLYHPSRLLAWSLDGTRILTNGTMRSVQNSAQLWDAINDREVEPLRHQGNVRAVAFSRNGKVAITGSDDHTARLWDAATGKPLGESLRHQAPVLDVALDSEGTIALTGSEDRTARLWAVPSGKPLRDPLHHGGEGKSQVVAVAFRPDGRAILTACDRFARLWTLGALTSPKPTAQVDSERSLERPGHVAYSPDGRLVLMIHTKGAQVRGADSPQEVGIPLRTKYSVLSVAWSPDGATLLTGGIDGTAQVWSARTRVPIGQPMVHQGPVHSVAFSPDSRNVLTGCADHSARLWDSSTGKPIGKPLNHAAAVTGVGFSRDGKVVLTRTENGVRCWERTPEASGTDERFVLWAQVFAGSEIDADGVIQGLDALDWKRRNERLQAMGGPPAPANVLRSNHQSMDQ